MPSLRGRLMRLLVKHLVGAKFKRAGNSVSELREMDQWVVKQQSVPKGTEIRSAVVNDIPAEWVSAAGARAETVVLYLHGGAFIMGSPATHRELAARVSAAMDAIALVIDYRLAPEHPFPAAAQDAVSAYRWLLDQGHGQKRIVIGGDSAGGGLALQTLIALRDEGSSLPAAAFFFSPITDWVRLDGESYSTRAATDPMVTAEMCRFTAALYVGDADPNTPQLSPIHADLSGLPPMCIHVGDDEVMLSDSVRLAERALAHGVDVELKTWPGMWHVFQASARFVPEARQSLHEIGRFVVSHVG
jgi:acetyl esterase/lipase